MPPKKESSPEESSSEMASSNHRYASASQVIMPLHCCNARVEVVQHPVKGKAADGHHKAWKQLDPEPVLSFHCLDPNFMDSPTVFAIASLVPKNTTKHQQTVEARGITLAGTTVSSLHKVGSPKGNNGKKDGESAYFVFPNLSVKVVGEWKLQFDIYIILDSENHWLCAALTNIFEVYPAKSFPGMDGMTPLIRYLATSSHVKIRKRTEPAKYLKKNGPSSDEYIRKPHNKSQKQEKALARRRTQEPSSDDEDDNEYAETQEPPVKRTRKSLTSYLPSNSPALDGSNSVHHSLRTQHQPEFYQNSNSISQQTRGTYQNVEKEDGEHNEGQRPHARQLRRSLSPDQPPLASQSSSSLSNDIANIQRKLDLAKLQQKFNLSPLASQSSSSFSHQSNVGLQNWNTQPQPGHSSNNYSTNQRVRGTYQNQSLEMPSLQGANSIYNSQPSTTSFNQIIVEGKPVDINNFPMTLQSQNNNLFSHSATFDQPPAHFSQDPNLGLYGSRRPHNGDNIYGSQSRSQEYNAMIPPLLEPLRGTSNDPQYSVTSSFEYGSVPTTMDTFESGYGDTMPLRTTFF